MKLMDRFRPKADRELLCSLNAEAWQARIQAVLESRKAEVCERLAQHLEALYPAEDMQLLARYKCTVERKEVNVQVRTPDSDRWNQSVGIELSRAVMVASSYAGLFCGGPRFSLMKTRGVTAEHRREIEAGHYRDTPTWEAFCGKQDRQEAERVPVDLEPFFFAVVAERSRFNAEYRQILAWPVEYKQEHA